MSTSMMPAPRMRFWNNDGTPAAGCLLYTYIAGTSTPKATYTDSAGTTASANPIVLDSKGEAVVYWSGSYKVDLKTAAGVQITGYPVDNFISYGNDSAENITYDTYRTSDPDITVGAALRRLDPLFYARTSPHANFTWFTEKFTITSCPGHGRATVQEDLTDVFDTLYSASLSGVVKYVAPAASGGSDANTGDGWNSPYLTLNKAIRTTLSGTVYVYPGSYDLCGFRYTDTSGNLPRKIIAPFSGVTFTTPGDTLSALTWTSVGGGTPNVWYCTLSAGSATMTPVRVLYSSTTDKYGESMPLQKASSIATVDTLSVGPCNGAWWYDSATSRLYVRLRSENVETTTKTYLSAIYSPAADNQFLLYSTTTYWENITFHGYANILKLAGQAVPEGWFKSCTFKYCDSNALNVYGGHCYTQDCRAYRGTADHANYNVASSTTPQGVEINFTSQFAGDPDTFGKASTQPNNPVSTGQNKNGSSNHDAYVVRVNGSYIDSYGPNIADTDGSYTWNLGVTSGYSFALDASLDYGWIVQGSTARAWLDGCNSGKGNKAINSNTSAIVYIFNTAGTQTTSSSGTFVAYTPG